MIRIMMQIVKNEKGKARQKFRFKKGSLDKRFLTLDLSLIVT